MTIVAFILAGMGAFIAVLNFYLSFVRYPLHRLFLKEESYKFSSGVPLLGSLLLWLGALIFLTSGVMRYGIAALILSLINTGGVHWFFISLGYQWIVSRRVKGET